MVIIVNHIMLEYDQAANIIMAKLLNISLFIGGILMLLSPTSALAFESSTPPSSVEHVRRQTLEAALIKMSAIGEADFASAFNKRRIRSCEVKESSIPEAGLGVFAKEKIKAGTILSFYPAHTLGINIGDEYIEKVSFDSVTGELKHESTENEDSSSSSSADQSYLIHILGNRPLMNTAIQQELGGDTIFIDVDLSQQEQPGFVSHRINDGATVTENNEEGILEYYRTSRRFKNCVHVPFGPSPLLATVATKKIKKGDELFTTYGCSYWLDNLLKEGGEAAEETDTSTELIILEAKNVAMDILKGMKDAAITHAKEAEEIQVIFDTT